MRTGAWGIRSVAAIEAVKGLLVLTVGFGLLASFHRDAQHFAERLVGHLHLNPAKHDPQVFIDAIAQFNDSRLWRLAALAGTYAIFRLAIAWGLWQRRSWAEWLTVLSAAIYIPFEIRSLMRGVTPLHLGMLAINLLIVAVMIHALRSPRRVMELAP
jgi:uncharacterized membrane protein (DUF2068 family)